MDISIHNCFARRPKTSSRKICGKQKLWNEWRKSEHMSVIADSKVESGSVLCDTGHLIALHTHGLSTNLKDELPFVT